MHDLTPEILLRGSGCSVLFITPKVGRGSGSSFTITLCSIFSNEILRLETLVSYSILTGLRSFGRGKLKTKVRCSMSCCRFARCTVLVGPTSSGFP